MRLCCSLPQVAESSGSRGGTPLFLFRIKREGDVGEGKGCGGSERLRVVSRVDAARRS